MLVKIEQTGSDLTVTFRSRNKGAEEINVERLRVGSADNANQLHGAPMSSKAAWDGATLDYGNHYRASREERGKLKRVIALRMWRNWQTRRI